MAPVILSQLSCLADDGIGLSDAAEITLDPTYKALWVSNRGQDGLVRMPLSSDDLLPPTVWTDVGAHPRHFWMSKHWLLIAAKNDGVVRVIMRDEQGVPDFESAQQIKIPSPVFILPLRQVGVETS